MKIPRYWRGLIAGSVAALAVAPASGLAFVEKTDTQGNIPGDLNGVWLVVSDIEHAIPTSTPAPAESPGAEGAQAAGESPSPVATPKGDAHAASSPAADGTSGTPAMRVYSVAHLLKIIHLKKPDVDRIKEEEANRQQASVEKANAIIAAERKGKNRAPAPTASPAADAPKVLVPANDSIGGVPDSDDVDIALLDVMLPQSIQESITKSQQAQMRWVPTDKDLALLRSSWSTLKRNERDEYSKIDWKVVSAANFDTGLKTDTAVRGSRFAITSNQQMLPRPGQPSTNILVFGVRKDTGQTLSGGHVRAMMATAPFPIPIDMKGSFTMYRFADLPKSTPAKSQKPAKAK
jgi:hypothetical protein